MRNARLLVLATAMLGLTCVHPPEKAGIDSAAPDPRWIERTLERMSLEERVAQLMFPWSRSYYMARGSEDWQELERLVLQRKVGGLVVSLGDVYEYAVQINKLQRLSDVPLLIAADFEFGAGMRIDESTTFPRAMAVGATRRTEYAYAMGRATAREARAVGVHQNYAPVADVNNNPANPVINTRAFGDDPRLVGDMAEAVVKGTQDAGVIATVKHFPGHGDTDVDTHVGLSILRLSKERMQAFELPPFRQTFASGVLSVMVGHLAVPALDTAQNVPATVSPILIEELLQNEMGYDGLIVTDAMDMRGVSSRYHPGESAVLAIKAGVDVVLLPPDIDLAIDAVVGAVKRGEIARERIDRSVRKLLAMKQWVGVDRNRFVDVEKVYEVVAAPEHLALAREIARKSITVLGNADGLLPLSHGDAATMLDIVMADSQEPSVGRAFHGHLARRGLALEYARIDPSSNRLTCDSVLAKAARADRILVQLHYYTRSGQMTGFISRDECDFIGKLVGTGKPVIAVSFGNPYLVMNFPAISAYVLTYSSSEASIAAAAEVLFGEEPAVGKLPITIPGFYRFGDGVEYPKVALRPGSPEEGGFDRAKLAAADDLMHRAVRDSAFPGGVLLVARNGVVVHHKAYGAYTYDAYATPVQPQTIYDLASVTKVISTTSAMMRLVGEGKVRLEDPVVRYLPAFGQQGKERITLYNLMVHNSGLPAWRKFYEFCGTPQCVLDSISATPLAFRTGDTTVYSDLGLITLGKVVEAVSGASLDRFVDSVFFRPLGMKNTFYNPPGAMAGRIAPTEVDTFWRRTERPVQGRVHDENCEVLGGVSGHAGLFSTASDLAVMLQMLLDGGTYGGRRYLREEVVKRFTSRQSASSTRGIGWDTPNPDRSWAGSLISRQSFIHTGFTGTSVAVDPERNLIVVLLTNRVYPSRASSKIFSVRPQVHDAIVGALER